MYVVDQFGTPNSPVFNAIAALHHDFASSFQKMVGGSYTGFYVAQCGDNFDGFLDRTLAKERGEIETSPVSALFGAEGFTTVFAMKFVD